MNTQNATVLLVDDDELVRESVSRLLSSWCTVLTAPGGPEGLELLAQHEIDLILSDQCMPGMSGDQFLALAAESYPEIERVLVTGYASLESVVRGVNIGNISYYLEKPMDATVLRPLVERLVERTRERRRLVSAGQLVQTLRPSRPAGSRKPFMLWAAEGGECVVVEGVVGP